MVDGRLVLTKYIAYATIYNMSKTTPQTKQSSPSALDSFHLSFEYDVSWRDAKKSLKERSA